MGADTLGQSGVRGDPRLAPYSDPPDVLTSDDAYFSATLGTCQRVCLIDLSSAAFPLT